MAKRRWKSAYAVAKAVRRGELPHATSVACVDCGKPAECYDRRDYSRPLDVSPVCKKCDCIRGPAKPILNPKSKKYKLLIDEAKAKFKGRVYPIG